ncbi:CpaF/VirB11 family protein [Microbispora bryophytorum]|uniref:CpaF family protein n=1 Tax=Microbispora bryophytorum TaxID=1460882 RepID=UPI0033E9EE55
MSEHPLWLVEDLPLAPAARPAGPGSLPPLPGIPTPVGDGLDDVAFRTAVGDISARVADALEGAAGREEAVQLIDAEAAAWARERLTDGVVIAPGTHARLVRAVEDERYGLGALQPLIADVAVQNIDINGCREVWVTYADGRKVRGPAVAGSDEELVQRIRMWGVHGGQTSREFSTVTPMLNAALKERVRLSAVMAITPRPHVSIRCHRHVDVTLADLVELGTLEAGLASFLAAAVRARKDILVTGGVNAGKTTMLRALAAEIDPDERIATLESEYELYLDQLPHRHRDVVAFESRQANSEGHGQITLDAAIKHSLRMNPVRIIVGEVRADEAWSMLQAMNSGQEGSLCTIHANSAEEVFPRLLMLCRSGGLVLDSEDIHGLVGMAVDFVVHLRRDVRTNRRYVTEVLEVLPPADTPTPARNHIYRPGPDGRAAPATSPQCLDDLVAAGFDPAVLWRAS